MSVSCSPIDQASSPYLLQIGPEIKPQRSKKFPTDNSTDEKNKNKSTILFYYNKKHDNELGPQSIVATDPASLLLFPDKSKKS